MEKKILSHSDDEAESSSYREHKESQSDTEFTRSCVYMSCQHYSWAFDQKKQEKKERPSTMRLDLKSFKKKQRIFWKYPENENILFIETHEDSLIKFCRKFFEDKSSFEITTCTFKSTKSKIQDIVDQNGRNLLIFAVQLNCLDVLEKLLKYDFDIDYEDKSHKNAVDHAWVNFEKESDKKNKEDSNKIILRLLKKNSKFPKEDVGFDYDRASKDLQIFIDMCEKMHQYVDRDEGQQLIGSLNKDPQLRYYYDRYNESVLFYALKRNRINIINDLKGAVSIRPDENLDDIYGDLQSAAAEDVYDSDDDYPQALHVLILNSKSRIINKCSSTHENWRCIDEVYKLLDQNEVCSKILQVVATCKLLRIVFDFEQDSSHYFDKNIMESQINLWRINEEKIIYIGAKNINFGINDVAKILIKEFCHIALKILHLDSFNQHSISLINVTQNLPESSKKSRPSKHPKKSDKNPEDEYISIKTHQCHDFEKIVQNIFKSFSKKEQTFNLYDYFNQQDVNDMLYSLKILQADDDFVNSEDLTDSMKAKIWYSKIIFQGKQTSFFELFNRNESYAKSVEVDEKILNQLSSNDIRDILLRIEKIRVAEPHQVPQKDAIIERKFIKHDHIVHKIESAEKIDDKKEKIGKKSKKFRGQLSAITGSIKGFIFSKPKSEDPELSMQCTKSFSDNIKFKIEEEPVLVYPNDEFGIDFDQIKSEIEESRFFVLADAAGLGKSKAFEDLSRKLKEKYKNFWISIIKIKEHQKAFEKYQQEATEVTVKTTSNLLIEVMDIELRLEKEIFKKLFEDNKVILLIDGVDEINQNCRDYVAKVFKFLRDNTKNLLLISTRSQSVRKLEETFKTKSICKLAPMTKEENEEIILEELEKHSSVNNRIVADLRPTPEDALTFDTTNPKIPEDLSNFIDIIEQGSHKISNPSMIQIIVQLYAEKDINLAPETFNLYEVFEKIYERQKLIFDDKIVRPKNYSKRRFTIDMVHQVYALKLIFGDQFKEQLEDLAIIKNWKREKRHWTSENIQRYGFLSINLEDDEDSINFIHKSYAEFFVAEFITSMLFHENYGIKTDEIDKTFKLLEAIKGGNFGNIKKFVSGVFEPEFIQNDKNNLDTEERKRLFTSTVGQHMLKVSKILGESEKM